LHNIKYLGGGFDFGERALITDEPRSATVMTITPTDLLVVDREVFSRFVIKIFIRNSILICLFTFVKIEHLNQHMKKNYKKKQNLLIDVLYFLHGQQD
jgi:CRP-like cAMP-binding protein